jgi:pimeloyl-ACP methyl ester carboxylesterase
MVTTFLTKHNEITYQKGETMVAHLLRRLMRSVLLMGLLLSGVFVLNAQSESYMFDGTSIQVAVPDGMEWEYDDEFEELILFNEDAEIIMFLLPPEDPTTLLEGLVAGFEMDDDFDASAIYTVDLGAPFTAYDAETEDTLVYFIVAEMTQNTYLGIVSYTFKDAEDNDWLLSVLLGLDSDEVVIDGGELMDAPDAGEMPDTPEEVTSVTSASSDDSADMDDDMGETGLEDVDALLDEYGVTGDLISIPEAFAPYVDTSASFEEGECIPPVPLDETPDTMICGTLTVPENRTVEGSNRVVLPVVILLSNSGDGAPAMVYLEGGPGGSATVGVADWARSPFRDTHDIVLFDQRGTGFAQPSLNCPEMEDGGVELDCYDRLISEGIDLRGYNSRQNAGDVADLIRELGYGEATLYGISYGTRLALTVLREHPELLTSVIIDAVYPPEVDGGLDEARYFYLALQTMFSDCNADPACGSAFPDLESRFFATIDALDENPVIVYDPTYDEETELVGADLLNRILQAMYATPIIPALPAAMHLAAEGDYEQALDLIAFGPLDMEETEEVEQTFDYPEGLDDAEGMFTSVTCNEEVRLTDVRDYIDSYLPAYESDEIPISVLNSFFDISIFATCEVWDAGTSPLIADAPVGGSVPVLSIGGAYDPVTPPAWAELAASRLDTSYFFTLPYSGHGSDQIPCGQELITQFLNDPFSEPDGSCIADMTPDFFIP